jgi:HDOD domain-containing protein
MIYPREDSPEIDHLVNPADYDRTLKLTEMLVDHLPRLPWFLRELQSILEDGSTDLEAACAVLKAHPAVCENFMRIGAMSEPAQPIRIPVDHVIVLLGKQRVWTTALAAYLLTELSSSWTTAARQEAGNIGLAYANRELARARMDNNETPEQAYAHGLLSVAGFLPLIEASGETDCAPPWLDATKEAICEQREIFGTDFLELNCWIRLLWRLPLLPAEQALALPVGSRRPAAVVVEKVVPVSPVIADAAVRNLVLVSRGVV